MNIKANWAVTLLALALAFSAQAMDGDATTVDLRWDCVSMDTAQTQVLYKTRLAPTRAVAEAAQQRQAEAIVRSQSGRDVGETICGSGLGRLLGYSAAGHTHSGYSATDHEHGSTAAPLRTYSCFVHDHEHHASGGSWPWGLPEHENFMARDAEGARAQAARDWVPADQRLRYVWISLIECVRQEDSS